MKTHSKSLLAFAALLVVLVIGLLWWSSTTTYNVRADSTAEQESAVIRNESSDQITINIESYDYEIGDQAILINGKQFSQYGDPGAPVLPVYSDLIELPDVGDWSLDFVTSDASLIKLPTKTLPAAPVPREISVSAVGALLDEVDRPAPEIYGHDAYYPGTPVITGQELWQRGMRYLQLKVFPFQYNPVKGMAKHYGSIDVSITLSNVQALELRSLSCDGVASSGILNPWATGFDSGGNPLGGALRLYTTERGIHEVTFADLQGAGITDPSTIDPSSFDMMTGGMAIALEVNDGGDGTFDPGDNLRFYAEPTTSRFMTENVYWLSYGGDSALVRPRIPTQTSAQPSVTPVTEFRRTVRIERSFNYLPGEIEPNNRPYDQDRFFDRLLTVSTTGQEDEASYDITEMMTYPLFGSGQEAEITGVMLSDSTQAGVRLVVGGTESGTLHNWSGTAPGDLFYNEYVFTESVPMDQFGGVPYTLGLRIKYDDFNVAQNVFPDYLELNYPAATIVDSNGALFLDSIANTVERVRLSGYSAAGAAEALIYDVSDPKSPARVGSVVINGTDVDFWSTPLGNRSFFAAAGDALPTPRLELDLPFAPNGPLRSATHVVDYIAIVANHPDLITKPATVTYGLDDLLAHRETQDGFTTLKVSAQDIYDEWSAGQVDQMAIRQFLNYAYCEWGATLDDAPSYVLLVGDGLVDFKHFYNTFSGPARPNYPDPTTEADKLYELNLIPPYLDDVNDPVFRGEVPVDVRFVSFDDVVQPDGTITLRDYLADMHLGRLPVQVRVDTGISATTPVDEYLLSPAVDLDIMVRKILEYEGPNYVADESITFAAGPILSNGSEPGPRDKYRQASQNVLMSTLPSNIEPALPPVYQASANRLYYDPDYSGNVLPTHTSINAATDAFRAMLDTGTSMAQWVGHGAFTNWGNPAVLLLRSAEYNELINGVSTPNLAPSHKYAITVGYGCQSSYFTNLAAGRYRVMGTTIQRFMLWHSLGESLIRAEDRGAIADIGATGNHFLSDIQVLNASVIRAIYRDQIERIGPALDSAKFDFAVASSGPSNPNSVQQRDILATMQLLGDPALRIQRPPVPLLEVESSLSVSAPTIPQGESAVYTVDLVNTGNGNASQNVDVVVDYDETALNTPSYISDGGYVTTLNGSSVIRWDDISVPAGTAPRENGTTTLTFVATVSYTTVGGQQVDGDGTVDSPEIFAFDLNEATFTIEVPTAATPFAPTPEPTATVPATGDRLYLPILSR
ncbi:MAG: hypothetical protein KDD73_09355 [Anaerolineales bacterium]|nr:hypothetical protein [Anaerolineales bacterium]MCB9126539.1 hypothetical protein [Ardenticatenales bacterium]